LLGRENGLPDLIVLCIDPKRSGWAVCNRLRKNGALKAIPLIVTSAEATEKDFEDHKKLKARAEEYLHKPFGAEALLEKIGGLISLPSQDHLHPPLDEVDGAEISLVEDAAALVEEEVAIETDDFPLGHGGGTDRFSLDDPPELEGEHTRLENPFE